MHKTTFINQNVNWNLFTIHHNFKKMWHLLSYVTRLSRDYYYYLIRYIKYCTYIFKNVSHSFVNREMNELSFTPLEITVKNHRSPRAM